MLCICLHVYHMILGSNDEHQDVLEKANRMLRKKYDFHQTTLQIEKHAHGLACSQCKLPDWPQPITHINVMKDVVTSLRETVQYCFVPLFACHFCPNLCAAPMKVAGFVLYTFKFLFCVNISTIFFHNGKLYDKSFLLLYTWGTCCILILKTPKTSLCKVTEVFIL